MGVDILSRTVVGVGVGIGVGDGLEFSKAEGDGVRLVDASVLNSGTEDTDISALGVADGVGIASRAGTGVTELPLIEGVIPVCT